MGIITLTTDLGLKDYYLSTIKGAILSQCPDATIVDISHDIDKHDIFQASFVLKNSYTSFPKGSIHIIGINPEAGAEACHLAVNIDGHYFIGADNGIFSLMFDKKPDKIVELNITQDTDYLTFPTKDIFVKAACHIARGGTLEVIGKEKDRFFERTYLKTVVDGSVIRGTVIYVDSYKNIITNITEFLFSKVGKGRNFIILLKHSDYNIDTISRSYNDVPDGEKLALFSSTGFLEIAINKGSASGLLGLKTSDTVRVEFFD
ncbi:MAG: SAM-dependent chlorinase/fluorinase [Bacteroidota bacterium]